MSTGMALNVSGPGAKRKLEKDLAKCVRAQQVYRIGKLKKVSVKSPKSDERLLICLKMQSEISCLTEALIQE